MVVLQFSFIKPFIIIYHFYINSFTKGKNIFSVTYYQAAQIDPQDGGVYSQFLIHLHALTPKNIRDNPKKIFEITTFQKYPDSAPLP